MRSPMFGQKLPLQWCFSPFLLSGCMTVGVHAPSIDVFGSYFPAWLICLAPQVAVAPARLSGIAPRRSRPIIKVNVRDTQSVRSGDLLFAIEQANFQLAGDRAQAALAALDQQIEIAKSQDAQPKCQVKAADAAVQ